MNDIGGTNRFWRQIALMIRSPFVRFGWVQNLISEELESDTVIVIVFIQLRLDDKVPILEAGDRVCGIKDSGF